MKLISSLTHYFQFLFSIQSSNQVVISCIYWIKRKNLGAESVRGRHRDDYMWFNICNSDVRRVQIFTHLIEFLFSRASLQKFWIQSTLANICATGRLLGRCGFCIQFGIQTFNCFDYINVRSCCGKWNVMNSDSQWVFHAKIWSIKS